MTLIDLNWRTFLEKGDEASFSVIYDNLLDDLYSYGVSLGFQEETCKDGIQDIFYKLYISSRRNGMPFVEYSPNSRGELQYGTDFTHLVQFFHKLPVSLCRYHIITRLHLKKRFGINS